jgi:hypothetical protein
VPFPHEIIPPPPGWNPGLEGSKKKKKKKQQQAAAAAASAAAQANEEDGEDEAESTSARRILAARLQGLPAAGIPAPPRAIRNLAAWLTLGVLGFTIYRFFRNRKKKGGRR